MTKQITDVAKKKAENARNWLSSTKGKKILKSKLKSANLLIEELDEKRQVDADKMKETITI